MKKIGYMVEIIFLFFCLIFSQYQQVIPSENTIIKSPFPSLVKVDDGRFFLWFKPNTNPPKEGYPAIFLFHGAAQHAFSWAIEWNSWTKNQASFKKKALQEGFFVFCLESQRPVFPGPRAWDVFEENASQNDDFEYITNVINWIKENLPEVNNKLYCAGFSSGAFMCSRLAISYDPVFSAIAINSGCNALSISLENFGPSFNLTNSYSLPSIHPPTLLLHGQQDSIVPLKCATNYYNELQQSHIESTLFVEQDQGHIWLKSKNNDVIQWFLSH